MARTGTLDAIWEDAARLVLAWNAVRLNREYRAEWEAARPYMEYIRRHITLHNHHLFASTDVGQWIEVIASRWLFELNPMLPILPDPDTEIPYVERKVFKRCFTECLLPQPNPWEEQGYYRPALDRFLVKCAKPKEKDTTGCWRDHVQRFSACPFKQSIHGGVFLRDPGEPPDKQATTEIREWMKKPAAQFDRTWRRDGDRAVFWISRMYSRPVVLETLGWNLGACAAERVKAGRASWDQSRGTNLGLVECFTDDATHLVIAVDMRAERRAMNRALARTLKEHLALSPFRTQWRDLEEGFDLYEQIEIRRSTTLEKVCIKRFGQAVWDAFTPARSWASEGKSRPTAIRNLDAALKRAKAFIEEKETVQGGTEQREQWKYWRYIVPEGGHVWRPTSPKIPPPIPIGPPKGRLRRG